MVVVVAVVGVAVIGLKGYNPGCSLRSVLNPPRINAALVPEHEAVRIAIALLPDPQTSKL